MSRNTIIVLISHHHKLLDLIYTTLTKPVPLVPRGSVDGLGAMLQTGKPRIRVLIRSLNFFSLSNPSKRTMALGLTQPLTEMSTRKYFWRVECCRPRRLTT
jgi:hypothetical protein